MAEQSTVNWGILGLGKIAHKFVDDLVKVPGARLTAVASRDSHRSVEFKLRYGAKYAYDNYETLVNNDEVEIIYIATPHSFHYEHTMLCLEHGKHVLCEKPIALNARQVSEMSQTAQKAGLFLMEALWTRFFPFMHDLVAFKESGQLGKIVMVEADFGFKAPFKPESRLFDPALGGGALLDIGIYPVFLAILMMGKPDRISARAIKGSTGVDLTTSIRFEYENAGFAHLHATLEANTAITARIYGTERWIEVKSRWHESRKMIMYDQKEVVAKMEYQEDCRGYCYEIIAIHEDLLAGKTENGCLTHQFSQDLMEVMDEIRKQIDLSYPGEH